MRTSESKGHWQRYDSSAAFEPEVRKHPCRPNRANFGFAALASSLSRPTGRARVGEQSFRALEVRPVVHHAINADRAFSRIGRERRDHRARLGDLLRRRREYLVDHRNLRRMDRHLSGKAVAPRLLRLTPQRREIAEL